MVSNERSFLMKKLTGFNLKYLALVLMVLDHIHYMFEFTGKVPIWFSWLGRIAAPLFLFCLIEGFIHTHDRKKYFKKIYLIGAFMGLVQFGFYNVLRGCVRGDGFFPQNAMLSSFTVLLIILQGIDWCREKKWAKGLAGILVPLVVWPILVMDVLMPALMSAGSDLGLFILNGLMMSFLPVHTTIIDGGTATVFAGIVMYAFSSCKNKDLRIFAWGAFSLLWNFGMILLFGGMGAFTEDFLFFSAYEWMEIFAIIPMLCYNGERGKGNGKLFYIFYPAHVYVLFALSILVYNSF